MILEQMERELLIPSASLWKIARSASHLYKRYEIPKKTGGTRVIEHPAKELKTLQRWLLRNVIVSWPVHDSAAAYRPGRSIRDHALTHAGARYLLRLDFSDFFHSITAMDLRNYGERQKLVFSGWSEADFDFLCQVVFKSKRLTVGAPSSPGVSNALCWQLDAELSSMAEASHIRYSRYADDLYFSSPTPNVLRDVTKRVSEIVRELELPANLRLNTRKTLNTSRKSHQRVTGVVLTSQDGVSLGRHRKRQLRTLIFRFDELSSRERSQVAGLLAFARSIEPEYVNSLIKKFGATRLKEVREATLVREQEQVDLRQISRRRPSRSRHSGSDSG